MPVPVIHTTLGPGRRVVIPAEVCRPFGLGPGSHVVIEASEGGVLLRPLDAVLREVQSFFHDAAPAFVLRTDEPAGDRRAEAERESHG